MVRFLMQYLNNKCTLTLHQCVKKVVLDFWYFHVVHLSCGNYSFEPNTTHNRTYLCKENIIWHQKILTHLTYEQFHWWVNKWVPPPLMSHWESWRVTEELVVSIDFFINWQRTSDVVWSSLGTWHKQLLYTFVILNCYL